MATIGRADLIIVPKFNGLTAQMNRALGEASSSGGATRAGESAGSSFSSGFGDRVGKALSGSGSLGSRLKSIASAGTIFTGVSKVVGWGMDQIAEHTGDAVARLDTLKNYPRVMESLGVSANEAQSSINMMTSRLDVLPTRLDDMSQLTQGIFAATKQYGTSLTTATKAGLALNDMLLAGGQGQTIVNAASEQFRQILAKGKPDMQDWRSLLNAAPGQMDQLAKSMLGANATATQLYYALGGGNEKLAKAAGFDYATLSMNDLLDAIIRLDEQGGSGIKSFQQQAEDASGGIETASQNFSNAWTKGIAKVMDSFGRENIVRGINDLKEVVNDAFDAASKVAGPLGDAFEQVADGVKYFDNGADSVRTMTDAIQGISGPLGRTAGDFDVAGQTVEHTLDRARESSSKAAEAHHRYLDQLKESAQVISQTNESYQAQAASLEYAGQVVDTYAGKTELTTAQLTELKSALDTINKTTGSNWQVSDFIGDDTDSIKKNTDAIWDNIHAREAASKADALGTSAAEMDKTFAAAANDFQAQRQATQDYTTSVQALIDKYGSLDAAVKAAAKVGPTGSPTQEAKTALDALGGWRRSITALREADKAQRDAAQSSRELGFESESLQARASGAELSISQLAATTDVAAQAFNDGGSKAKFSIQDFGSALDAASRNKDKLREAIGDPETMAEIVAAYDGTAGSLKDVLNDVGVEFDAIGAKASDDASTVARMGDALYDLGDTGYAGIAILGTSIDELSSKLVEAGVSTKTVTDLGAENFERMAAAVYQSGGSVDGLVTRLSTLDKLNIDPKTITVNDDGTIETANHMIIDLDQMTINGKRFDVVGDGLVQCDDMLIDLNNMTVSSKNFSVSDDWTITDMSGKVIGLNDRLFALPGLTVTRVSDEDTGQATAGNVDRVTDAINRMPKTATVTITANDQASGVIAGVRNNLSSLNGMVATSTVRTIRQTINEVSTISRTVSGGNQPQTGTMNFRTRANAGITGRGHAAGGIEVDRNHADGLIAIGPMRISARDIIGENGAEYYDGKNIVPLTNRYYSQPFADVIADAIGKRAAQQGPTYIANVDGVTIQATSRGEFVRNLVDVIGQWEGMSRT